LFYRLLLDVFGHHKDDRPRGSRCRNTDSLECGFGQLVGIRDLNDYQQMYGSIAKWVDFLEGFFPEVRICPTTRIMARELRLVF